MLKSFLYNYWTSLMDNETDINKIIDLAHQLSNNNNSESAIYFYNAAKIAKNKLKDDLLHKKCLYHYHVEKLKSVQGKSIHDIDSIIVLLKEMSSLEDDRLTDRLEPVIDFFTVLKFCLKDEIEKVESILECIRKKTENESVSQIQSITHLLCESVLLKQVIKECSSKVDGSLEEVFEKITLLENCVERHRKNKYLSEVVRIIFERYHKCIESLKVKNIALIISKCIDPVFNKIISTNVFNIITEEIRQKIGFKMIDGIEKISTDQMKGISSLKGLPDWFPKAGFICGFFTLIFFMGMVIASVFDFSIPKTERYLVITVLSLGLALSSSFLGGYALAQGKLPLPFAKDSPIKFSVAGGFAVFVITFALGYWFYCTG